MNNNSELGMSVGTGEGAHGAVSAVFTRDMVERFSGKGGLFEDLAFDQPEVTDKGDPNNPLDDRYASGRIPALKAVQISAFTNYMDEVAHVLEDSNYDSRSLLVNRVTDKWTELIQETFDADADRDSAVARDLDKTNKDTRKIVDFIVDKVATYGGKQVPGGSDLAKAIIKSAAGKAEDAFWPTDHETKVWPLNVTRRISWLMSLCNVGSPVSCMTLSIGLNVQVLLMCRRGVSRWQEKDCRSSTRMAL